MIILTPELPAVALNVGDVPQTISLDLAKFIKGDVGDVNPQMPLILADAIAAKN